MASDDVVNRMKGCFYGCAVGDALGISLEFQDRDVFPTVTEMLPSPVHRICAGSWTDDTSMMLCLAASMAAQKGHNDHSELAHYLEWAQHGYLSVNGRCFDIGGTVRNALWDYEDSGNPIASTTDTYDQGNGSLMRIAPVPIFYWNDPEQAYVCGSLSSHTTHAHTNCKTICGIFSYVVAGAIQGKSKPELLTDLRKHSVSPEVQTVLSEFLDKSRDQIKSSGYVLDTLEAALWAFFTTETFEQGAILTVNLAGDADTIGAIYGTLAGAHYGFDAIPTRWLTALQARHLLDAVFEDLMASKN
jgi:ADP-ribosyl-[dinitrogen reductase] hydrolase